MAYLKGSVSGDDLVHAVEIDDEGNAIALCWRAPAEAGRGRFDPSDDDACPDCALRFRLWEERHTR